MSYNDGENDGKLSSFSYNVSGVRIVGSLKTIANDLTRYVCCDIMGVGG